MTPPLSRYAVIRTILGSSACQRYLLWPCIFYSHFRYNSSIVGQFDIYRDSKRNRHKERGGREGGAKEREKLKWTPQSLLSCIINCIRINLLLDGRPCESACRIRLENLLVFADLKHVLDFTCRHAPRITSSTPYVILLRWRALTMTPKHRSTTEHHGREDQGHVDEGGGYGRQAAHRLEGAAGPPTVDFFLQR